MQILHAPKFEIPSSIMEIVCSEKENFALEITIMGLYKLTTQNSARRKLKFCVQKWKFSPNPGGIGYAHYRPEPQKTTNSTIRNWTFLLGVTFRHYNVLNIEHGILVLLESGTFFPLT